MAEPRKLNTRIIHKHAQAAVWDTKDNFVPLQAEMIVYDADSEHDYQRFKLGDGKHSVTDLPFARAGSADTADEATKLSTARNITITGDVAGGASFDGSKDITINTQLQGTITGEFTGIPSQHTHVFNGKAGYANAAFTPAAESVTAEYTPEGTITAPAVTVDSTVKTMSVVTNPGTGPSLTEAKYTSAEFGHSVSGDALTLQFTKGSYTPARLIDGASASYAEITYVESINGATATTPVFSGKRATIESTFVGKEATITSAFTPEGEIQATEVTSSGEVDITYSNN